MKDVLVIGAGPAGSVAAAYLVNQGYSVTVVEKSKFPRFTIGESLLPLSMEHFEEVGMLDAIKAANFEVKSGALFIRKDDEIDISFDENFTPGWTWTWQVPRDEFDHILIKEAEKKGAEVKFEATIAKIDFQADKVVAEIEENGTKAIHEFKYVLDSSGNAGVLSKMLNFDIKYAETGRRSLFTQVKETNRERFKRPMRITFEVLEQDLWYWVIPFSNGNTSLGFVGNKKWFDIPAADQNELFRKMMEKSDHFIERFEGKEFLYDVRGANDYTNSSSQLYGHRFVLAGNTTGFIDPVFSSGVAIATESAIKSAKLIEKELKGEKPDWDKEYVQHMKQATEVFHAVVDTWYNGELQRIFFHSDIKMEIKKQLTSILAGYVWDVTNPFVKRNRKLIKTVAHVIGMEEAAAEAAK
ncbi:tryptophan 7-halogenase [Reichenbachiella agarivorans]|uniref:Tryptophan 7-halogenase n=1 Tax=Reichenbachiella agarivorans TaxID=2979464 RepID=A0ABY6CJQ8_9BACT|nr:NAD(P)/FAD-dependent oxidoreductase [Reichenbachiella agarivorans]UXP30755.1 tryptophan 7-halogenase [Reichenbachiella agarivorans]